jgi:hypothetical protein
LILGFSLSETALLAAFRLSLYSDGIFAIGGDHSENFNGFIARCEPDGSKRSKQETFL